MPKPQRTQNEPVQFTGTTIHFDTETLARLRQLALDASRENSRSVTMAELVRIAVAAYFDFPEPPFRPKGRPAQTDDVEVQLGEKRVAIELKQRTRRTTRRK